MEVNRAHMLSNRPGRGNSRLDGTSTPRRGGAPRARSLCCLAAALLLLLRASVFGQATAANGAAAAARIDVCGPVMTDTTWTAAHVYVQTCGVTVAAGVTLTVEPGTVVKLGGSDFVVNGTMVAEGTAEAPIVFTSLADDANGGDTNGDGPSQGQPGQWFALTFGAGSHGRIAHAIVQYGGGNYWYYGSKALIRSFNSDLSLDHVTLQHSANKGLYAENTALSVTQGSTTDNGDYGLYCYGSGASPIEITDNVFSGDRPGWVDMNGQTGAVTVRGNQLEGAPRGFDVSGKLQGDLDWDNGGDLVMTTAGRSLEVDSNGVLHLRPGSVVKLSQELVVRGELDAEGTVDAPIVFSSPQDDGYGGDTNGDGSSTAAQPGQWWSITFVDGGWGRISHGTIRYGGGNYWFYSTKALVRAFNGGDIRLEDVELAESGLNGLYAENSPMLLRDCRIVNNEDYAVFNWTPKLQIDARQNWWGDASGPYHRTKNPNGTGGRVSDGVLFFPWAVDEGGTVPTQVLVEGPTRVSPGETVDYSVSYFAGQDIEDPILALTLPVSAAYLDSTAGGALFDERQEVFWKLANLRTGDSGLVSVRVQYVWGLPGNQQEGLRAVLAGRNFSQTELDVADYLAYEPFSILRSQPMSVAEFDHERSLYPALDELYARTISEGSQFLTAAKVEASEGPPLTAGVFLNQAGNSLVFLGRMETNALAITREPNRITVQDPNGGASADLQTGTVTYFGQWSGTEEVGESGALGGGAATCTVNIASKNCFKHFFKRLFAGQVVAVSGVKLVALYKGWLIAPALASSPAGWGVIGLVGAYNAYAYFRCFYPDINKWCCERDSITPTRAYWIMGAPGCRIYRCDLASQEWSLVPEFIPCAETEVCVEGVGCRCSAPRRSRASSQGSGGQESASNVSCHVTRIAVARDPNAKLVAAGDVIPGQPLEYTVTYENEGEGRAYGVYITDVLSPDLDESTLDLRGQGVFAPVTRQIAWDIGELAPKGQAGSKGERTFTARVKPGVPSGTVITNQAIVYFPSVPEETPTNTVVNVVQPLVAAPQSLETPYGTPIGITLSGRDVSETPLTFAIDEPPLAGDLTGTAPNLTYTPADNFAGQDRLTFTVNNGVSTSRAADVTILVTPSSADLIAPQIVWTYPEDGAVVEDVSEEPLSSDDTGPLYAPSVFAGLSEAMDPNSITGATVKLVAGADREVEASVLWDGTANQAVLTPREAWQEGLYTATVTTGVRDASGNPLAAESSWSFRIGAPPACAGDCNGDENVKVDELIKGVNMALGTAGIESCPSFDTNGSGSVTVEELIKAVNNALSGCVAAA
jgi:uncharacterized repeat protein (TIGR01451 family)